VSDPKNFDNATVEKIDTGAGEVIMITIPTGVDVKEVDTVAVDEIGELADDVAKDTTDALATGDLSGELIMIDPVPMPEKIIEPEPEILIEPKPVEPVEIVEPAVPEPVVPVEEPKLHVCGPHNLNGKYYDLSQLGTEKKEGYYSKVTNETEDHEFEGWLQWNYC
jgi:hypothetical protein